MKELKDDLKKIVTARLYSFLVNGLNLSPLAGKTLVQYAGSLTGRDFRIIVQAAPFVLYDLVSQDRFQAWLALSMLAPLIWMQDIDDMDVYIVSLTYKSLS